MLDTASNLYFEIHYIVGKTHGALVVYSRRKYILCNICCEGWTLRILNIFYCNSRQDKISLLLIGLDKYLKLKCFPLKDADSVA